VAAVTVYSAPDDGRKGRRANLQLIINTILPELHLVGLLYNTYHDVTLKYQTVIMLLAWKGLNTTEMCSQKYFS